MFYFHCLFYYAGRVHIGRHDRCNGLASSVCLSVPSAYSPWFTRGQHATRPAYISARQWRRPTYWLFQPRERCKIVWSACLCVYLFFCLSVCSHIAKTTHANYSECSVHVTCGCGSVLLWRQCNTLCNFGFMDDVMFSYNGTHKSDKDHAHVSSSSPGDGTGAKYGVLLSLVIPWLCGIRRLHGH